MCSPTHTRENQRGGDHERYSEEPRYDPHKVVGKREEPTSKYRLLAAHLLSSAQDSIGCRMDEQTADSAQQVSSPGARLDWDSFSRDVARQFRFLPVHMEDGLVLLFESKPSAIELENLEFCCPNRIFRLSGVNELPELRRTLSSRLNELLLPPDGVIGGCGCKNKRDQ